MRIKTVLPYGNQLLVKQFESDDKSAGGLYIPESAKKKPSQGKVLAVGIGKRLENGEMSPIRIDVGNLVLFTKFTGVPVNTSEGEFLLVEADNVLAVFEVEG